MGWRLGIPALTVWLAVVAGLISWEVAYGLKPGPLSPAPAIWPETCPLPRPISRGSIILALHPLCPCSAASISQLGAVARAAAANHEACPDIVVLICAPADLPDSWTRSPTCDKARALPNTRVISDSSGQIAAVFGMKTSGAVVVYDSLGRLAFAGGLTASRGEPAPSPAVAPLIAFVHERGRWNSDLYSGPVFGCELVMPQAKRCCQ